MYEGPEKKHNLYHGCQGRILGNGILEEKFFSGGRGIIYLKLEKQIFLAEGIAGVRMEVFKRLTDERNWND